MEQKIKLLLFIKIFTFILLSWACHFYIYMNTLNSSLDASYNYRRKIYLRTYRLLSKCKRDKNSNIVCLKEEIQNNRVSENKYIPYDRKKDLGKKKQPLACSRKFLGYHKQDINNKLCILETNKYSILEKKIFKELDYEGFLKNNKTINDKLYKKILCKKYGLRLFLPLLVFLLLLSLIIVDLTFPSDNNKGLWGTLGVLDNLKGWLKTKEWLESIVSFLKNYMPKLSSCGNVTTGTQEICFLLPLFRVIIYVIPLVILGVTIVLSISYYHKKVKKYETIKFRKR
ncbi:fam-l protein [Plasmodium malariae]|uniref:Fam-l protein n=1 Tax=Plasmodium malariae TaxID=5858 RepID=A0A1D3JIQ9_PLAMA|nr:fam-l protein [Plasmodium malariae]SBT86378.1 fam-l protein [Plasmodium malariae]